MIILELNLISFGKFRNKQLKFNNGINLVYGKNETGKTTIHKFIEGMLFGFYKPYSKRRLYTEEYDKYYPWNYSDYRGMMLIEFDDEIYRLERDFIKGSDDLKVFDDRTGEDITKTFEYDPVLRLHTLDSIVLGFNSVVYNNTVSIKQLGCKTDQALAREIKDSLINMGGSLDEDISVKRALAHLNNEIASIGSASQKKSSPYGQIVEKLEFLKMERCEALKDIDLIKKEELEYKSLENKLKQINIENSLLKEQLNMIDKIEAKEVYESALKLSNEINQLSEKIISLKKYSNLDFEMYKELNVMEKERTALTKSLNDWKEELCKDEEKIKLVKEQLSSYNKYKGIGKEEFDYIIDRYKLLHIKKIRLGEIGKKILDIEVDLSKNSPIDSIVEDIYEYEKLEETKNSILFSNDFAKGNYLKTRLEEKNRELKKKSVLIGLMISFIIFSAIIGVVNNMFFIVTFFLATITAYLLYSRSEMKQYVDILNEQLQDEEKKEVERKDFLKKIGEDMDSILDKHYCLNKAELIKILNEKQEEIANNKYKNESMILLKNEKKNIVQELSKIEDEISKKSTIIKNPYNLNLKDINIMENEYLKYLELFNTIENLEIDRQYKMDKVNQLKDKKNTIEIKIKKELELNDFENITDMENGLKLRELYDSLDKDIENKKILLENILDNRNIEDLKAISEHNDDKIFGNYNLGIISDKNKIIENMSKNDNIISEIELEMTRIEERVKSFYSNFRPLVEIEEDILDVSNKKTKYDNRLKSLQIAKDTIERISKSIQRDFAPTLNKKVSEIMDLITDGRYSEVKINEDLDITVEDSINNTLVNIESLSGGTMDQLYFATRFAIADIILNENTPLILDDCFIQYDDARLNNIIKILDKISFNRQIILFTCHTREGNILNKLGIEHNTITL